MFLVCRHRLCGTIECFAASGNRPTKKGCGVAAALLLEGLSLLCADRFSCRVSPPLKSFVRAIVACPGIVKDKNDGGQPNVPVFPDTLRLRRSLCSLAQDAI